MVLAVQAMRNFIPPLEHLATMLEDAGASVLSAECSDLAGRLAESEKSLTGEGREPEKIEYMDGGSQLLLVAKGGATLIEFGAVPVRDPAKHVCKPVGSFDTPSNST